MIAILADNQVGQQARSRQPFVDRHGRLDRRDDRGAGRTGHNAEGVGRRDRGHVHRCCWHGRRRCCCGDCLCCGCNCLWGGGRFVVDRCRRRGGGCFCAGCCCFWGGCFFHRGGCFCAGGRGCRSVRTGQLATGTTRAEIFVNP